MRSPSDYGVGWMAAAVALWVGASSAIAVVEETKLTGVEPPSPALFGSAVGLSGDIALIGDYGASDAGEDSGAAYLFDVRTGQQLFRLVASDAAAEDSFAQSVAIDGATAVIGTVGPNAAYVFDVATGQERFKLTPLDGVSNRFGYSVGISGTIAVVGALTDDEAGDHAGAAYVFDTATGQQLFKMIATDARPYGHLGRAVAVNGTSAIVGGGGGGDAGNAYLFDVATGQQNVKLIHENAGTGDEFGYAVAITAETAIVGAPYDNPDGIGVIGPGAAYLFDVATGQQLHKLTPSDGEDGDFFGISVAISGNLAVVGSLQAGIGAAYVFDTITGQELLKLSASDGTWSDSFGVAVAIDGQMILVGAEDALVGGFELGAAYLYTGVPEPGSVAILALVIAAIGRGRR